MHTPGKPVLEKGVLLPVLGQTVPPRAWALLAAQPGLGPPDPSGDFLQEYCPVPAQAAACSQPHLVCLAVPCR